LNQEISSPLRQEFQVGYFLPLESSDHTAFEAFKRDRLKLEDGGNRVGGNKRVIVSESHEGAVGRAWNELELGFKHDATGALGPNQRAADMKAAFGKEFVEVVTRNTSRDPGEALTDQRCIIAANLVQPSINLGAASAVGKNGRKLGVRSPTDRHPRTVIEQDFQRLDIVDGF